MYAGGVKNWLEALKTARKRYELFVFWSGRNVGQFVSGCMCVGAWRTQPTTAMAHVRAHTSSHDRFFLLPSGAKPVCPELCLLSHASTCRVPQHRNPATVTKRLGHQGLPLSAPAQESVTGEHATTDAGQADPWETVGAGPRARPRKAGDGRSEQAQPAPRGRRTGAPAWRRPAEALTPNPPRPRPPRAAPSPSGSW